MSEQEFIQAVSECAVKDMEASGILASVSIAQAILESGYGTTELARNANNFFGMKCSLSGNTWGSTWDGVSKYTKQTKEQDPDGREYTVTADFRKYPDMESSVRDHSCYLNGAMNGKKLRYAGLKGERDYKTAIQIIKDGGYATDVSYVSKVCGIIERYCLTKYDTVAGATESEGKMSIAIIEKMATQNPCYKAGVSIAPKGGMLHSVGCPQPDPLVFVKNWQRSGGSVCVHAVVGKDAVVYQLLPWNMKGWHCGKGRKGSGNNSLISIEMTEPASIKYTGGANWIETGNGANTKSHVLATYANAVQFFAHICKKFGFNPEDSNVLMSHHEGNVKGIASNHGDVEHIWSRYGLSMNQFRKDVKKAMAGENVTTVPSAPVDNASDDTSGQKINVLNGSVTVIYNGADGLNIRKAPSITAEVDQIVHTGIFAVVGVSADEKWYKLESGLFITAIPDYVSFKATEEQKASTAGTGYYRVRMNWADPGSQIGAFKDQNNAIELCKQNSGYKVFDNSGNEIYPCVSADVTDREFKFRVAISDLRIRKGPGTTFDYHKKNGQAVYTGEGTFTIVKTKDGPGAKLWGLLKSYETNEDGWIALDEEYGKILS